MARPKYPHMRPWEERIMDKFHRQGILLATWDYDVPLKVRKTARPPNITEREAALWDHITAKRVDAVAETDAHIYVIEIKDRLRPSAVGQALTYKYLYEEQFSPLKPVVATIVTEFGDPDMQAVCKHYNIRVWII
jgi:hypothetical protein